MLRRLHPDPAEPAAPAELISGLRLGDLAPHDRAYVVVNMVQTVDGRISIGGRSGPIGDDVDREVFHLLRTQADAVFAGTGTLRTERYGRMVRDPGLRAAREREGLAADPLALVVTRTGGVPWDIPLFAAPEQRVAVYSATPVEPPAMAAEVTVHAEEGGLGAVMRRVRAEHGVRSVLCEGGPTVNGALLADGVLDELFLTTAPKLAGEWDAPGVIAAPAPATGAAPEVIEGTQRLSSLDADLVWLLESQGSLYARDRLGRAV